MLGGFHRANLLLLCENYDVVENLWYVSRTVSSVSLFVIQFASYL